MSSAATSPAEASRRCPIRTVSLLARGSVGEALARFLAEDKSIRVASVHTDGLWPLLRRLFPRARRFRDVTSRAFAEHCRKKVDCILSIHCSTILPEEVLRAAPHAFNLHPGFLPYGRGYWPTYWALVDGSPAGASLHRMEALVDRGPVIARKRVKVLPTDTGEALTRRVNEAEIALFRATWPRLKSGRFKERYAAGRGTYHDRAEGIAVRRLKADQKMTVGKLVDTLRAFTDSRFDGCCLERGGRKVFLRLSLHEAPRG